MDAELLMIFTFVIIVVAIIGGSINGIVQKVLDYKRSQAAIMQGSEGNGGNVAHLAERTEMIEDRLKVLERLATDRGALLADEIEALRSDVQDRAIAQDLTQSRDRELG